MAQPERKTHAVHTTKKTVYTTLQAVLLYWRLLSNATQEQGFKFNEL